MVNNTDNSKLYEIVKQTLSNYEAPYDAADWAQMQNILDLAPKSKSFKFKHILLSIFGSLKSSPKSKIFKWIFSVYSLIGLIILGGAYLIYTNFNFTKTPDTINSKPQQKIENTVNTGAKTPITPSNTTVLGVPKTENKIQQPLNTSDSVLPTNKKDIAKPAESAFTKKEIDLIEKTETKKTEKIDTSSKSTFNNPQQVIKNENESVTPDTRDSSKEIIGQPKEKGKNTKVNKKKHDNINADSLTRYFNSQTQDSLKVPK